MDKIHQNEVSKLMLNLARTVNKADNIDAVLKGFELTHQTVLNTFQAVKAPNVYLNGEKLAYNQIIENVKVRISQTGGKSDLDKLYILEPIHGYIEYVNAAVTEF